MEDVESKECDREVTGIVAAGEVQAEIEEQTRIRETEIERASQVINNGCRVEDVKSKECNREVTGIVAAGEVQAEIEEQMRIRETEMEIERASQVTHHYSKGCMIEDVKSKECDREVTGIVTASQGKSRLR